VGDTTTPAPKSSNRRSIVLDVIKFDTLGAFLISTATLLSAGAPSGAEITASTPLLGHGFATRIIQRMVNYSMRCPVCSQPVPEQHGAGRPRRYCSPACRSAAERSRIARRLVLGQMVEQRMRRGQPDE